MQLEDVFSSEEFAKLTTRLHAEAFFPPPKLVFRCLSFFECADTKAVILGQDPYHGPDQAVGLSFSVPPGAPAPPSLRNIRMEVESSTGKKSTCRGGSLVSWAEQGVLLLNATLTVTKHNPGSHTGFGWNYVTDRIIELISDQTEHTVFLLWGKDAQKKSNLIDEGKHFVLRAPHPSPFSARKGFFGCNHFRLANEYLARHKRKPINW